MRFVSWNCCEGFDRKLPLLRELGCELAVLCEVPEAAPAPTLTDADVSWSWVGDGSRKGLALAGFGIDLDPVPPPTGAGVLSTAAAASLGVGVLGIWTMKPAGSTYGAQVVATIEAYEPWLRTNSVIVAGDFNIAPGRSQDQRTGQLRRAFGLLGDLGYVSVYHHLTGDPYGEEQLATYFHRRHQDDPWHIDFCFVQKDVIERVTSFEVGTYGDWVATGHSDHVPLIVDVAVDTSTRSVTAPR